MPRRDAKVPASSKPRRTKEAPTSATRKLPVVDELARLVNQDQSVVRAQLGLAAGGDLGPRADAVEEAWRLTKRQREVLELVAVGMSNKAIASRLGCAQVTVELHMTRLLARARSESRAMLVAKFWTFPVELPKLVGEP